ncbi:MAG: FAD-binding protein [Proteobacteria bacterium]|nr:FAD-binding protein [Pseudomonadota bacterium]
MATNEIIHKLPKWDKEADVVIVGYGGAGAVSAITAHDDGAKVLILEKLPPDVVDKDGRVVEVKHHPSSRMTAALIYTPANAKDAFAYQKRMNELYGYDDVPDDMLQTWAEMIVQNFDWLKTLKGSEIFEIHNTGEGSLENPVGPLGRPEFPEFSGSKASRHICNPQSGWGWFGCLAQNVADRGIEVLYGTPAKELVQNPNTKEILGVIAERDGKEIAIKAKRAVVLTCGGFEYDMEMQSSYLRVWPFRFYGNPGNTGDGIRMALNVGAKLWHMNNISGRITAWWPDYPIAFTILPWGWERRNKLYGYIDRDGKRTKDFKSAFSFILVDKHGQRFANEVYRGHTFYWEVVRFDTEKAEFPRIPCHLIFDEKTRTSCRMATTAGAPGPIKLYEWSDDNSKEIERGWIKKGTTLRELAGNIDVPADALEKTVARFNQYCKEKKDPDFERRPGFMVPLDTPPYYEINMWPGGPNTQGGPKRDKDARVLNVGDRPIPKLYSAGELGSIYGFLYEGGGNTSECIAFGRIAGKNAAAEKPWE